MKIRLVVGLLALLSCTAVAMGTPEPALGGGGVRTPPAAEPQSGTKTKITGFRSYVNLTSRSPDAVRNALREIKNDWHPGGVAMMVDAARFSRSRDTFVDIVRFLQARTEQRHGSDLNEWYKWLWSENYKPHPEYAKFKTAIYEPIDPRFAEYFTKTDNAKIRLDEIRWGGVRRDGIPPLKNPEMIPAKQARYLADTDVVFGVSLNGDTRCYPKRILAWHEMFKDTIGGEPVCGAY